MDQEPAEEGWAAILYFIDEIQFVESIPNPYLPSTEITFVDVVMGLMKLPYVDIYITGSNSRMLSSEVLTQFRDRGDEVRVYPLSYEEFLSVWQGDIRFAFNEYCTYGGMPVVQSLSSHEEKSRYLNDLFVGLIFGMWWKGIELPRMKGCWRNCWISCLRPPVL